MSMYIVVWRNSHRDPHLSQDYDGFLEIYSTYEQAKEAAEKDLESQGPKSQWYYDYAIYKEATD